MGALLICPSPRCGGSIADAIPRIAGFVVGSSFLVSGVMGVLPQVRV